MTDWFLQALSVIPRGSWGYVARRFTMIRWFKPVKELRFWSWIGLGVDPAVQPLKWQFPRGIVQSQAPRRHQGDVRPEAIYMQAELMKNDEREKKRNDDKNMSELEKKNRVIVVGRN
ncbi:hypothetical protein F511_43202 [Dorcoceras hygrometricum]|uniref:Uncharacterized protein n=1 Tax=Dorcoceras hygrometricum TaxID=472368 RepID=A0A2Z7AJE6_9LAMI|nr:hypothetical protein F511_43202 [Dorcoceras hygrometricum]